MDGQTVRVFLEREPGQAADLPRNVLIANALRQARETLGMPPEHADADTWRRYVDQAITSNLNTDQDRAHWREYCRDIARRYRAERAMVVAREQAAAGIPPLTGAERAMQLFEDVIGMPDYSHHIGEYKIGQRYLVIDFESREAIFEEINPQTGKPCVAVIEVDFENDRPEDLTDNQIRAAITRALLLRHRLYNNLRMQCAPDDESPGGNDDHGSGGGGPAGGAPKASNGDPGGNEDQGKDSKDSPAPNEKDDKSRGGSKKPKHKTAFFGKGVRLSKYETIPLTEDEVAYDNIQPKSPKFTMTYDRLDNSEHHEHSCECCYMALLDPSGVDSS
eukprot:3937038-Rhodomonas_salina.1